LGRKKGQLLVRIGEEHQRGPTNGPRRDKKLVLEKGAGMLHQTRTQCKKGRLCFGKKKRVMKRKPQQQAFRKRCSRTPTSLGGGEVGRRGGGVKFVPLKSGVVNWGWGPSGAQVPKKKHRKNPPCEALKKRVSVKASSPEGGGVKKCWAGYRS